jgi:hypothetical protein
MVLSLLGEIFECAQKALGVPSPEGFCDSSVGEVCVKKVCLSSEV